MQLPLVEQARALREKAASNGEMEGLLQELEQSGSRPLTPEFLELGLSGRWQLLHCTPTDAEATATVDGGDQRAMAAASGFVAMPARAHFASVSPGFGTLTTVVPWSWAEHAVDGTFTVECTYLTTADSRVQISRTDASLAVKQDLEPALAEPLFEHLQACVPEPVLDPHKCIFEVPHLDAELMLTHCSGVRHRGARTAWERLSWSAPAAQDESAAAQPE